VQQENIGVTEEEKRKEQVRAFIEKAVPTLSKQEVHTYFKTLSSTNSRNLTLASIFRKKKKEPVFDSGPEAFNLLMKEAIVKEFLDERDLNVFGSRWTI
jgi:voltage-dependent calcium channel